MAKAKAAAAPKKKAAGGGSKFDIQQFLLDKGEKIGLIVAGVAFALFALLGVLAASGAANPSTLSNELKNGADRITAQLRETPGVEPPPAEVPDGDQTMRKVKPSEFVTRNEMFNSAGNISEKRNNPMALPLIAGEAFFAAGGVSVYDIHDDKIATLQAREKQANNVSAIDIEKLRKRAERLKARMGGNFPQQPPPPPPGGAPGAVPGGGPGGIPSGPPMGGPGGPPGGGRGPAGPAKPKSEDLEITYVEIGSKSVENAQLAINLLPSRMAVIRGLVPYKAQVAKHLQALRLSVDSQLEAEGSAPTYRGFEVERQTLEADGKTVRKDWTPFDPVEASREFYRIAEAVEAEDPKYTDFVPDPTHKLYLPRLKLVRGGYQGFSMPELGQALQALKEQGGAKDLTSREKKLQGKDNLFDLRGVQSTPAVPGALPPGAIPPQPGAGRGGSGRGGFDVPMRGGALPGGLIQGQPNPRNTAVPVWLLQFVDPSIESGLCYRYRIALRMQNPNYGKTDLVAYPGLAQQEEIKSDWFEIPGYVYIPPEEYLYAAGDKMKDRTALGTADYDTTTLKLHRWYDYIRVTRDNKVADAIGEWVVADIDAKRGQHVRQEKSVKIPLWSMVAGSYIFRDRISIQGKGLSARAVAKMENVRMAFDTATPTLLVDFEGGRGSYRLPNGQVLADESAVEALLLVGIEGGPMKLIARNAAVDKTLPDRQAREEGWLRWLDEVARAVQ